MIAGELKLDCRVRQQSIHPEALAPQQEYASFHASGRLGALFVQEGWISTSGARLQRFSTGREDSRRVQIETGLLAVFSERSVPAGSKLAGWAALVRSFNIHAPVRHPSCVSEQHVHGSQREDGNWKVFDKRYWPGNTLADHLGFALRHEDIDLLVFKRLSDAAPADAFAGMVRAAPSGIPSRRAW